MTTIGGSELDIVKLLGQDDTVHVLLGQPVPHPLVDQDVEPALPVALGIVSRHRVSIASLHDSCELIPILRVQRIQ